MKYEGKLLVILAAAAASGISIGQTSTKTEYDSSGHVIQRETTNGKKGETRRADGSFVSRTEKEGNTLTTYDSRGSVVRRSVTNGDTTTTHDSTGKLLGITKSTN